MNEMKSMPGMVRERRARLLAEARHDIQRALGKAGFGRQFREPQRREAGLLGGLEHAGVADGERGRDRAAEHLARIVPGNDVRRDALGLPDRRDEKAVEERDRVAVQLVGRAAVIFEIARHRDRVGARLLHRLAGVARFQPGEFLGVILDQAAELGEQSPALDGGEAAPGAGFERLARGGDGEVDVRLVAGGDRGEHRPFRGRDHRQRAAGRGGAPAIVDEDPFGGGNADGSVHWSGPPWSGAAFRDSIRVAGRRGKKFSVAAGRIAAARRRRRRPPTEPAARMYMSAIILDMPSSSTPAIREPSLRALSHIPGSDGWPVIGSTLALLADPKGQVERWATRYGRVYRNRAFGSRHIALLGPEANEFMLLDHAKIFSSKHGWGFVLEPPVSAWAAVARFRGASAAPQGAVGRIQKRADEPPTSKTSIAA